MEAEPEVTEAPSLWGFPTTLTSLVLQAFACPVPWGPHYIPPSIRGRMIAAGLPSRGPPLGLPEGSPAAGLVGALKEVVGDCTLKATDEQYGAILSFGNYDKYAKPDLLELLACIAVIALGPLTAQQLQLFLENRLGAEGGGQDRFRLSFLLRVFRRVFLPLLLFCFLYLYFVVPGASPLLLLFAGVAFGFLLSFPSLDPPSLASLPAAFLLPCYTFALGANVFFVFGAQCLFCLLIKLFCRSTPGTVSLARLLGDGELSTLRRGHLIPFADHRSMQMVVTCVAILGVDFLTFPRKYCKSVNSGVTLMDLGVGGIIFTSGMVSRHAKGSQKQSEPFLKALRKAALQSGPLGVFGLARLIFMSLTNLHVSVTEYGMHWNFYMTLMVVYILGELVCTFCVHPYAAGTVGLVLLGAYQCVISVTDLDEWMIDGPRTNFFSANREGIFGSIGFLSLFLLAVAVGHFFITRSPSKAAEEFGQRGPRRLSLLSLVVCAYLLSFLFTSLGLLLHSLGLPARRRFVNLPWVAFVGGIELFAVATATFTDALASRVCKQWSLRGTNDNQLIIFLVANLCVGSVNLSVRSLLQPAVVVLLLMTSYMTFLFFVGHRLGRSGRRIKLL